MEERGEWAAASGGLDLAKAETPRFSGAGGCRAVGTSGVL